MLEKTKISTDAILYAWMRSINWGGQSFHITISEAEGLKDIVNFENHQETGQKLWDYFRKGRPNFYMFADKIKPLGKEFCDYIIKYEQKNNG